MRAARRRTGARALLAPTLATMALFALLHATADLPWLRRAETLTLDLRFRLRGPRPPGPEVAVVLIDEASLRAAGRWPLPRRSFAALTRRLDRAGARVIAFDVLFAEPEPDGTGDEEFARAVARAGRVALPFAFRFDGEQGTTDDLVARAAYRSVRAEGAAPALPLHPTGLLPPLPGLAAAALGHSLVALDVDGAPRYEHLVVDYDLDYLPSLAVRIVQLDLGVAWDDVAVELGRAVAIGPLRVPTDRMMRMLVNYRGPPRSFPTYSFADVVAGAVPDEKLAGRIVLVGAGLLGLGDRFETPFSAALPGVERLANAVDTMLRGDALRRPAEAPLAEALALMLAAALIAISVARLPIVAAALVALSLLVLWLGAAQAALAALDLWLAAALPAAALVVAFTVAVAWQYGVLGREHRRVRDAFAHYLAPDMIEELAAEPEKLRLGGELREITVLFCDLRGFTGIAERLSPEALTRLVNRFLTVIGDVVHAHGGTVSRYTGDGLMAFWNAPLDQRDHAARACRAALAMQEAVARLSRTLEAEGDGPGELAIGIGINTGPGVVGNFGTATRFDYSAHGDAVNVAARLEAETKNYGVPILVGAATAAQAPEFATVPVDRIALRGRRRPVELRALTGEAARDDPFAALR